MYRCSECGNEYDIKPKYCDCGNDTFIETEEDIDLDVQEMDYIDEDSVLPKRNNQSRIYKRKTFSPFAIVIFVLCIILSLLVLFVIANPKNDIQNEKSITEIEEKTEIPSVDKYWDNTPVKTASDSEIKKEEDNPIINAMPKIVQEILPKEEPQKSVSQSANILNNRPNTVTQSKKISQKTNQKVQNSESKNNTKTVAKTNTSTKSASTASNQNVMTFGNLTNKIRNQYSVQNASSNIPSSNSQQSKTNTQIQTSNSQSNTSLRSTNTNTQQANTNNTTSHTVSPRTIQTSKAVQNFQTSTSQILQTPVTQTLPTKTQAQLKQELASYKSGLRNNIARKIDFTKVIGDGECVLTFKINSAGRLTSKSFTVQSSNITLNDAAFNALNTTTSYNAPPEGYNGETLKLKIKFYNGNFEISLN